MEPPNINILATVNNETLFIPARLVPKIPNELDEIKKVCLSSLTRDGHKVFIYRDFIHISNRPFNSILLARVNTRRIDLSETDLKIVKAFLEITESRREIDIENIPVYHKLNSALCNDEKICSKLLKASTQSKVSKLLIAKDWLTLQGVLEGFEDACKDPFLARLTTLSKTNNSAEEFSKLISLLPIHRQDVASMDLLNNPNVSDFTVKIGDKEFRVNALYIRSQSPVIDEMLKFGLAETGVIELREDIGTVNALHVLHGKSLENEPNPALKFYTECALELLGVKDIAPSKEEYSVIHALEMKDEKLLSAITNPAMAPIIIGFLTHTNDKEFLKMGVEVLRKNFPELSLPSSLSI